MVTPDDKRDLEIHRTIERAYQTISTLHNISRKELRERTTAFNEAEEEEEREAEAAQRAIDSVLERETERA